MIFNKILLFNFFNFLFNSLVSGIFKKYEYLGKQLRSSQPTRSFSFRDIRNFVQFIQSQELGIEWKRIKKKLHFSANHNSLLNSFKLF